MAAVKVIAQNKKARHDFHIEDTYEAGIVLTGTEIKSIRQGRVNLRDSFARIENGEVFLYNMHISPYEQGNIFNHEPRRTRKLLLHKGEIRRLVGVTQEKGFTLVPLRLYFRNGFAKLELAVARGKKLYDKRGALRRKDEKRRVERALAERQKGIR